MGIEIGREGGILDPNQSRHRLLQDCGTLREAVRKKWPITQENMERALSRLMNIIEFSDDEDTSVSAIKTLSMLVGQNQKLDPSPRSNIAPMVIETTATVGSIEQRRTELLGRLEACSVGGQNQRTD